MGKKYFATFTSGCQQIITNRLSRFPAFELKVLEMYDGLVIFESGLSVNQLSELRFFNNVFGLIANLGKFESIDEAAKKLLDADYSGVPKGDFKVGARIMSQTVALRDLAQVQKSITDHTGAVANSHHPALEYQLLMRDDGRTYWGWRLPSAGYKNRTLEAGELRPQIAHIMGLLAGIDQRQVVLDPFAGYGAIVRECLQGFHCQKVIAVESNIHLIPHLKSIPHLIAEHGDAARLDRIEARSIDRVITDPPWGKFGEYNDADLEHLYYGAIRQMHRVLRAKGVAVILSAYELLPTIAKECGFNIERSYHVLISGKKATLYKLRKLATPVQEDRFARTLEP